MSQRQLTVSESLQFELTILPFSLFDEEQYMRKSQKAKLGKHLKNASGTYATCNAGSIVIDGGWLIHQINWESDQMFSAIAANYTCYVKNKAHGKDTLVVFDGYNSSPKDHDHRRRLKCSTGCAEK